MLKVYGASDDLIELDGNNGDVNEEFGVYLDNGEARYLGFSDGTVLRAVYDEDGIWRLTPIFKGTLYERKEDGVVASDTNDVVWFRDGVKWCGDKLGK
jgi:hypothetical protein